MHRRPCMAISYICATACLCCGRGKGCKLQRAPSMLTYLAPLLLLRAMRRCVATACPSGMSGEACDVPCGSGKVQDGTSATCTSCPAGTAPNFGRSYCVAVEAPGQCTLRPTTSVTSTFDCPPGWTRIAPGTTRTNTGRCITTAAASNAASACTTAWAALGANVGAAPALKSYGSVTLDGQQRLVCGCTGDEDGAVLKQRAAGSWRCSKEAVFLPNDGLGGDSPNIQPTTPGIWYDLPPGRTCSNAQGCWDMCFFADGRPKYHDSFTAAKQVPASGRSPRTQEADDCSAAGVCELEGASDDPGARMFYEACRRWGQETTWFGNQHSALRAHFLDSAASASWKTSGSCGRIWPYRPSQASSKYIDLYGLQSLTGCPTCWGESKAELVNKPLVRYG